MFSHVKIAFYYQINLVPNKNVKAKCYGTVYLWAFELK